ncbi:MAG: hypothetical protein MUF71_20890 [Candidatus Kapabacteria bacterium]|nr:hypothetical protein [Candidatus Kapabacteria bacterium]
MKNFPTHLLTLTLPDDASVTVEVLDKLNRVVATPLDRQDLMRGTSAHALNSGFWASGVYTVRVRCAYHDGTTVYASSQLFILK